MISQMAQVAEPRLPLPLWARCEPETVIKAGGLFASHVREPCLRIWDASRPTIKSSPSQTARRYSKRLRRTTKRLAMAWTMKRVSRTRQVMMRSSCGRQVRMGRERWDRRVLLGRQRRRSKEVAVCIADSCVDVMWSKSVMLRAGLFHALHITLPCWRICSCITMFTTVLQRFRVVMRVRTLRE